MSPDSQPTSLDGEVKEGDDQGEQQDVAKKRPRDSAFSAFSASPSPLPSAHRPLSPSAEDGGADVFATIRKVNSLLSDDHQEEKIEAPRLLVAGPQTEARTQLLNKLIGKPILPLRQRRLPRQAVSVVYNIRPGQPGSHYTMTIMYAGYENTCSCSSIGQLREQIRSEIEEVEQFSAAVTSPLTMQITGPGLREIKFEDLPDPIVAESVSYTSGANGMVLGGNSPTEPDLVKKTLDSTKDSGVLLMLMDANSTDYLKTMEFPLEFTSLALLGKAPSLSNFTFVKSITDAASVAALWTSTSRRIMRRFITKIFERRKNIPAHVTMALLNLIDKASKRLYAQ
jgi:hypothetical protein